MRSVRLADWQPSEGDTDRLAQDIYVNGRVVLREGAKLTPALAKRLQSLGFASVLVKEADDGSTLDDENSIISTGTRRAVGEVLRETRTALRAGRAINEAQVRRVAHAVVEEVMAKRPVLIQFAQIRTFDDYLIDHSISVCALSVMLALHLGIDDLNTIAIGALLHDIGKIFVPAEILSKSGPLSPEEKVQVESHTRLGFNHIRRHREFSLLSAHVAYQHHERLDGSGYPRRLKGDAIHRYARIVAVADVFDALTNDRPYREKWSFPHALRWIADQAGQTLDEAVVKALISRVAAYPVGSCVRLNTSETCVVVRQNRDEPARPVVKVVVPAAGTADMHELIDLSEQKSRRIVEVIDASEVRKLLGRT